MVKKIDWTDPELLNMSDKLAYAAATNCNVGGNSIGSNAGCNRPGSIVSGSCNSPGQGGGGACSSGSGGKSVG